MTIRYLLLCASVMALSGCVVERMTAISQIPATNSGPETHKLEDYEKRFPNDKGVYIYMKQTEEYTKGRIVQVQKKYIVLDADDQDLTTFQLEVSKYLQFSNFQAEIHTPDGKRQKFYTTSLKRQTDSYGDVTYSIVFPGVVRGTIVTIHYETFNEYGVPNPFYEQFRALRYTLPADSIVYKLVFPYKFLPEFKASTGAKVNLFYNGPLQKRIYTYAEANAKPFRSEQYSPYYKEYAPYLQFRVYEHETGKVRPLSTWSQLHNAIMRTWFEKSFLGMNPGAEGIVNSLRLSGRTDEEKIKLITEWVQKNIEVDNRRASDNPEGVGMSKKGNAPSIAGFAYELFNKAGLNAFLVVASGAENGTLDPNYVTLDDFDYPAVLVQTEQLDFLLLPFQKLRPYDVQSSTLINRDALLMRRTSADRQTPAMRARINPEYLEKPDPYASRSSLPARIRISGTQIIPNVVMEKMSIELQESGNAKVTEQISFSGEVAFHLRTALEETPEKQKKWLLENLVSYDLTTVNITKQEVKNQKDISKFLVLEISYEVSDLLNIADDEVVFQTAGFLSPFSLKQFKLTEKDRISPIAIDREEIHIKEVTITTPPTWINKTELADFSNSNKFGSVTITGKTDGNTIKVTSKRTLNRIMAEATDYQKLMDVAGENTKPAVPYFVFSVKPVN